VSDEAADHLRLCVDQTVAGFRGVAVRSQRSYPRWSLSRHPRWTCTHAAFRALVMPNGGSSSLAWLSADPYIPVARDDRDGTVVAGHAERRLGVRVADDFVASQMANPPGPGAVITARWIEGSRVSRRGLVGGRIRVAASTWVWR
jgi:hypothetical protein